MSSAPVGNGSFQPYSGFGYDRPYQDGIFIRSQFMDDLRIEARENDLKILSMFGEKLGATGSRPGERFMVPTQSNVAVGDIADAVTSSGYSFPDYIATDSPTVNNTNSFSRKIGAGASFLGIPLPLQDVNEGQVELVVNQYRGAAMVFTKRFIETCMGYMKNPSSAYAKKLRYAIMNDIEEYAWLSFLYTGPLTATASDYGTGFNSFTDAIGITNRTNYALTRTLTSINGAANLITPTANGSPTAGMSNTGNARFSTNTTPYLFGSTGSDISFDTLARVDEVFNQRNVPMEGRGLLCEPKGYGDIKYLPQFSSEFLGGQTDVYKTGRLREKILNFEVGMTNVIQPAGSGSNVNYEIAASKGALLYEIAREPDLIIDNKLNKPEMAIVVMGTTRYGAVVQRPDHTAIIQTRTRA